MPTYYSPLGNPEIWKEKPEGYFTVEEWEESHPVLGPSFEESKALATTTLREKRKAVEYGGFELDGLFWDSTEKDELRLNSILKMFEATGTPSFSGWKISEGQYIELTPALALNAAIAMMQHYAKAFAVEANKASQVQAMTTVEEVYEWLETELDNGW